MNVREGMRRLTLTTSLIGFLVGAWFSYRFVSLMVYVNAERARFEELSNRPKVKEIIGSLLPVLKGTGTSETVNIGVNGVKSMDIRNDEIEAMETEGGERVYDGVPASYQKIALTSLLPALFGGLIPWSIFWFWSWIVRGFTSRPGSSSGA